MKNTLKRVLALVLMMTVIITAAGCTQQQGKGDTTVTTTGNTANDYTKSLKILAIGNSFSVDGMQYLWNICKSGGIENVVLGNLYIGGCTLDTHWSNISEEKGAYTYYKNTQGAWLSDNDTSVQTAIKDEQWDIITVQQASGSSGKADTYTHLSDILNFVKANKPKNDTKIMWHMTWAYQGDSSHGEFSKYDSNQLTMYKAITDTVKSSVLPQKDIVGVIPSGTAIQNLRSSYIGDTITRDGYHLSYNYGRYTAALTWFTAITGISCSEVHWVPSDHIDIAQDFEVIRESVAGAIKTPYEVTKSKYDTKPSEKTDADLIEGLGLDINNFTLLNWNPVVGSFYDSTKGITRFDLENSEDGTPLFYVSSDVLKKADLPAGSVIIQDYGYQYVADAWESETYVAATRPAAVYDRAKLVTDQWWGKNTMCAISLSYIGSDTFVDESDSEHLRIYVPKK
ncbi:MAG: DUF4886 domain-containing protein [Clostridia bacterium]|nr:DUF4886 domain-containing protein [Clostridia bacterium]